MTLVSSRPISGTMAGRDAAADWGTLLRPHVALTRTAEPRYPDAPPYHPDTRYPEYPRDWGLSPTPNLAYDAVRECLRLLGLDAARYGTAAWNPLGEVIRPGARVLVKPNWVLHTHFSDLSYESVVTHSAVIRAVVDYAVAAAGPGGSVIVADAPLRDADFAELRRRTHIDEVVHHYAPHELQVELADLRYLSVVQRDGFVVERVHHQASMGHSRVVDVGRTSAFADIEHLMHRVGGADYDRRQTRSHHTGGRHEYRVSQAVLDADVVISVGKLKTHKKTGVTLSMKNLVGINVDKNFLPHYRIGMPSQGGDEFPERKGWTQRVRQGLIRAGIDLLLARAEKFTVPALRSVLRVVPRAESDRNYAARYARSDHPGYNQMMIERFYSFVLGSNVRDGNWRGNDTTWRMAVDLNTILLYADREGRLRDRPARGYFSVIDGIVGGAGEGPMNPTPAAGGVVLAGFNPLSVDWCGAQVMGLDPDRLKVISGARNRVPALGPEQLPELVTEDAIWRNGLTPDNHLAFTPHSAWADLRWAR
jgi:uncharacterized protein (DUF362 family)